MDVYLLRVKASFMVDFYSGVEKIFEIMKAFEIDDAPELHRNRIEKLIRTYYK